MPDAAHYLFGLLDSTALGWTVDTPLPAAPEPFVHQDDVDSDPAISSPAGTSDLAAGRNFYLDSDRALARGWPARARDNVAAIRLLKELEAAGRAATHDEQAQLLRFIDFGAR